MHRWRVTRRIGALAVVVLLAVACGSASDSSSGDAEDGAAGSGPGALPTGLVNQTDAGEPVSGGILNFSEATPTLDLDPRDIQASGATGSIPGGAIFDTLMRYDPAEGTFEPQMAKALTGNGDHSVWTLQLRPNVHFTDGTPLDAKAVVFNLKRYAAGSKATYRPLVELISTYETPDPLTVVFHLSRRWAGFPFLLASTPGMMVSPTAAKAAGEDFGQHPVGAGPFKVASYVPGESLELVRNDGYWGGKPHLDGVTFTSVRSSSATVERLESGQVQMVLLEGAPEAAADAVEGGYPGYLAVSNGQGLLPNITKGAGTSPTSDVRVRRAIAAALNLEQLNQRVAEGKGFYDSRLYGPWSPVHPEVPGPAYDPAEAERLVEEVKAETGWDGAIRLTDDGQNDPALRLTIQAQLERVGFDVNLDVVPSTNDLIRKIIVDKDFELATWGFSAWDAAPWATIADNLYPTTPRNFNGYKSPAMEGLLDQLVVADSPEAKAGVMTEIQELINADVPFIVTNGAIYGCFWAKNVHGVTPTLQGAVLLDEVYIEK